MSKNRLRIVMPAGLLGLSLVITPVSGADEETKKKPVPASATKAPGPATAQPGMVVVKDSTTGKLRAPTAEEAAALAAAAAPRPTTSFQPRLITLPRGGVGMTLDDSTAVFAVVTKKADGTVSIGEVTGDAAARAAASQSAKPSPTEGAKNEK